MYASYLPLVPVHPALCFDLIPLPLVKNPILSLSTLHFSLIQPAVPSQLTLGTNTCPPPHLYALDSHLPLSSLALFAKLDPYVQQAEWHCLIRPLRYLQPNTNKTKQSPTTPPNWDLYHWKLGFLLPSPQHPVDHQAPVLLFPVHLSRLSVVTGTLVQATAFLLPAFFSPLLSYFSLCCSLHCSQSQLFRRQS